VTGTPRRLGVALTGLSLSALCLIAPSQALAESPDPADGLLSGAEAMARARESGTPVVASALTDEHTVVTADPTSGVLKAEITAKVARVPDGDGGWRVPSTALARDGDGWLRPEAGLLDVRVSAGGAQSLVEDSVDGGVASWSWPEALPPARVAGDAVTYAEVWPSVDLVVKVGVEEVETFLVVKTRAAANDARVRSFSLESRYDGLAPSPLPNGAVELRTPQGEVPLVISPARMWDSRGAEQGLSSSAEAVDESPFAASSAVEITASSDVLEVEPDISMLDDPDTVYPVVIDPSWSLTRSYVVRVTEDFDTINDMSVDGKVGYNGWTQPYYKSRMFFRFLWPTNQSHQPFTSGQIRKATFEYVQTHSPQHSPCKSTSTAYGPAVRVKLYGGISSSTTWPGPGAHEWSSVTHTYAVGHEDYCADRYRQVWNITKMVQDERAAYPSWSTINVGVTSADETDAMGWRHYDNEASGTYLSPKLVIEFEPEPLPPTDFAIAPSAPMSSTVVTGPDVAVTATASLAPGYDCAPVTTQCLRGYLTITDSSSGETVVPKTPGTDASSGGPIEFSVSGLTNGSYTALLESLNVNTNLWSPEASFAFTVDLKPAAPAWHWVVPEGWDRLPDLPPNVPLKLQVTAASGDTDVQAFCVVVDGVERPCQTPDSEGLIAVGAFSDGVHRVSVAAQDSHSKGTLAADNPTTREFPLF